jgi:hypothetical protein
MGEGEDHLVDHLGLAARARYLPDLEVVGPMADDPGIVEAAHGVVAVAAGHGWDVRDVRLRRHGRPRRLDIARLEFGGGMGVEHRAELVLALCHQPRPFATFFSIASQIIAAMSLPPNC